MKFSINIDDKDFERSKELYIKANKIKEVELLNKINLVVDMLKETINLNYVSNTFNLYFNKEIAFIKEGDVLSGKNVSKRLCDCKKAYFFIVTLGVGVDRLINKFQYNDIVFSVLIDNISSIIIDIIAQKIQDKISDFYTISERYSCGYGDYSISNQVNLCKLLFAEKIGVILTTGGMLYPTKTISAVIGIKGEKNV